MTAPIRSMPVPAPHEAIAIIRCYDDLVEALRTIKAIHGLSNAWCDEIGGLTTGHTDKVLGPSSTKGLSRMTMDVFFQLFAISLEMRIDIDQARKMEARWEQRESGRIHVDDSRVSKKVLQKAKPHVLKEIGRLGGLKAASHQSALLVRSKGGKARMKSMTKQQRSALGKVAAETRWRNKRAREIATKAEKVTT